MWRIKRYRYEIAANFLKNSFVPKIKNQINGTRAVEKIFLKGNTSKIEIAAIKNRLINNGYNNLRN